MKRFAISLATVAVFAIASFAFPVFDVLTGVNLASYFISESIDSTKGTELQLPSRIIEKELTAPTVVFSDDFSTNSNSAWTTTGAIGASSWSVSRFGADWGARRNTSPQQLEITNDTGVTGNANGWAFASVPLSTIPAPYSATLSSNPGLVTWQFNMRQIRPDPAGFSSTASYGVAYILSTNSTSPDTGIGKTGYAVTLGESGTVDPIHLVRFSGGLQNTVTPIIDSNTAGLTDFGAEYLSVRVTYNPSNNQWELFLRNDGTTAFSDPGTGTLVSQGTVVDSTYVNTAFTNMGAYWQGSIGGAQTAFFDNVSISIEQPTAPGIQVTGGPLNYGNQAVGTTSVSQSVTITNTGAANLVLGTLALTSGTHFSISTNPSGATIAPTESVVASITFTPTSTGAKADTLNIPSNASGPVPTVALTGTGINNPPQAGPVTVNGAVGTAQYQVTPTLFDEDGHTVTITGINSVTGGPAGAVGSFTATTVTLIPTNPTLATAAVNPYVVTYSISDGFGGSGFGTVTVFVHDPPIVTTNAATNINSTSATLNGTATSGVMASTITARFRYSTTNPGTCNVLFGTRAPAAGSSIIGGGGAFSETITGLSPGTVYYFCALGSNLGGLTVGQVLSFTTAAPEINVTGNGITIVDGDSTPTTVDDTVLPSVNVLSGTSTSTYTIQNTGTGNLNIASVTISGVNASEFQLTTPPASTVAPGASTTFTVTFDPTGEGLRNATVNIDSDDADEDPYDFAIRGTGYYVPVLGNYPNSMVGLSGNTTVTPSVPLIYAEQAYAWTSPSFQGQLAVDPATGNVNITNARPAGTYTVNVRAQNGASYDSTSFTLTVMADECINTSWFVNTANVDVGSNPQNLAVGDFNGDGKQDIVTGNVNDRTLTILLRNAANNGYDSELIGNFNDLPAAIASGDLNNDGRQDLAIVFNSNDEVQLYYRNTANTGFSYGQTLSMNDSPIAVTIADLNGDGRNDIASANSTPGTATVYVRTTANNSFVLENHYSFGSLPYSIVAADLNGDGKTDLAGSNRTNPGGVTVLLRNAANNGYDAEPTVPTGGDLPYSLAAGDLNGDGRQDIVAVNYLGLNASVLYRNAAGTGFIQPAELYDMGGNPRSVALGDFNQDGRLDIVSGNIQNAISVLLRNSANTGYLDRRLFNANDDVIQVAVGDVNGDTIQDVVGVVPGNDQVAIFRGVCVSPEVSVSGNGQNIPDGDATPSPSNNTAFGPVLMDGGSVVKTFTIENTGLDDLEIFSTPRVIVGGLNPTDFSVTVQPNSPITPSGSTTFEVTFNPTGLGLRQAVIYFQNNDRDEEIFDFLVVGTGTRPETTISSLNRTAASPNNANTVSWQAVFNDAVSGVNPTNFNLVNVGLDGSPFVTVAPAGGTTPNTTWNVSASTWTGSGLLGLTLVNDDAVSHTLTNTPFTGEAYVIDRGDPAITYTPLTNAVGPGDRTFSVFGTDNVGINEVRVFWQVNGGSAGYAETQCTQTGGTPQNGMWGCSILDGPGAPQTNPGTVSYWVTAVDAAGNLTASPSDAGPSGGQRNLYTIGSGGSIDVSLFSDFDNVALGSEFTFNGDAEVKQALTLNGLAYTGDYTLALGCNTSVNGAGSASYVVGKVKRRFCATETFEFPVGGPPLGIVIPGGIPADNYSPLTVTITDGIAGSSLTVSVTDGFLPGLLQAGACSRYWTVNETGDLTADLTFKYRDVDDASNEESQWRVYRRGVGFPVEYTPYVNNFAVNQMTAQNVSQFSSWGFGQSLAPTSAPVTISGRVRTLDGRGLKGAIVTMTDGFGVIRQTTTSTFGYYRFEGVSTGESYVLGVSSKRYRFTPMLVNVTEELRDLDFYPDPQ